jgi:threonine-phosphate decarboxylase
MMAGHGDDSFRLEIPIKADFSSNVWFGGTPPELLSHLRQNLHLIGNYPEPDAADLFREIAGMHGVNPGQALAFNGSVEAFYTIALAFRQAVSSILVPAFAEYEDACRMHNHQLQFFRKKEWEPALKPGPNLIWMGNPNNPDGHIYSISSIEQALKTYPNTVFVVDEAYAAFIPEFQSAISLTQSCSNLIVVRSLTKCCAIPGLRLGYVVASAKIAERLRKFQQPWSVNALAQEAGKFIAGHPALFSPDTLLLRQLSSDLQRAIGQSDGFRVVSSGAPFFLIEMQAGTAAQLKRFLLDKHGILIRDAANFRGLGPNYFRVSALLANDNQLLLNGLSDWKGDRVKDLNDGANHLNDCNF